MGNTITLKQREDIEMLEITEKLIRDFQYHINLVDHSLVSFARSIDSMRASCGILQKDIHGASDTDVGDDGSLLGGSDVALLLKTIDEVVSDHKFIAAESLSRFFSFIIDMGNGYFTSETETILSVDKYRHNSFHTDMSTQYCDIRIESLQRKIKTLTTSHRVLIENEKNLNEREIIYQNEKNFLKNKIKDLEKDLSETRLDKENVLKEKYSKEQENDELVKEIKVLKLKGEKMAGVIGNNRLRWEENAVEMGKCNAKISTLDQELIERMALIKEMQSNIDILKKENVSLSEDFTKASHTIMSLKEENKSAVELFNNEIEKLKTECRVSEQSHEKDTQKLTLALEKEKNAKEELEAMIDEQQRTYNEDKESSDKKLALMKTENDGLRKHLEKNQASLETLEENSKMETNECMKQIETLQREKFETISRIEVKETELKSLHQENLKLRLDLSNERQLGVSLREQNKGNISALTNTLNDEIKQMNTTLKQLFEGEVHRLKGCLHEETIAKDACVKQLDNLQKENHLYAEKKITSDMKLSQLEEEIRRLKSELETNESTVEALKREHMDEMDRQRNKIEKLKSKTKEQKKEIDELIQNLNELKEKNRDLISDMNKEINNRVTLLEEKTTTINMLNKDIKNMKTECEDIKKLNAIEKQELNDVLIEEKNKQEEYKNQLRQQEKKQDQYLEEINRLNADKVKLTADVKGKLEKIDGLSLQLELATKNVLHVQVHYGQGFRAVDEEKELQNVLKTRMAAQCIELQFLHCSQAFSPLSRELPSLIICSRTSKTNRDRYISNVLGGVKVTPKTALLIFHERDERAFRKEMEPIQDTMPVSNIGEYLILGTKMEYIKAI